LVILHKDFAYFGMSQKTRCLDFKGFSGRRTVFSVKNETVSADKFY